MVKKGFIRVMFAAAALSIASCATNSDIDDLKDQLGDLENQIGQLERAQQEALLAQIAMIQAQIDGLDGDYSELSDNLSDLQNDVATGNNIYYGNLVSDVDYDLLASKEATIVTGDVYVSSDAQAAALANVTTVGGNVYVQGGSNVSLDELTTVGVAIIVEGVDGGQVTLPKLAAVSNIEVKNNDGLWAFSMPELVLVDGDVLFTATPWLEMISMPKLETVKGDLNFDLAGMYKEEMGYVFMFEVPAVAVEGDAIYAGIAAAQMLEIGDVSGSIEIHATGFTGVSYMGTEINGDLVINRSGAITELLFDELVTVKGDVAFQQNPAGGGGGGIGIGIGGGGSGEGFTELAGFDALTVIEGNVTITGNGFDTVEAFNNVEYVNGGTIKLHGTAESTQWDVFNALLGQYSWDSEWSGLTLDINVRTEWFTGFASLTQARYLDVTIGGFFSWDEIAGESVNGDSVFSGFDAFTTAVYSAKINIETVSSMDAFSSFTKVVTDDGNLENVTIVLPANTDVLLCPLMSLIEADFGPRAVKWTNSDESLSDLMTVYNTYIDNAACGFFS